MANLDFAVKHVDMIGLSFVRDPSNIQMLQNELAGRKGNKPGIVLKIETGF